MQIEVFGQGARFRRKPKYPRSAFYGTVAGVRMIVMVRNGEWHARTRAGGVTTGLHSTPTKAAEECLRKARTQALIAIRSAHATIAAATRQRDALDVLISRGLVTMVDGKLVWPGKGT